MRGRYHLIAMPQRVSGHTPVTAEIVDMRTEFRQGKPGHIQPRTAPGFEETLVRKNRPCCTEQEGRCASGDSAATAVFNIPAPSDPQA